MISSSLAPRSSALRNASSALRSRACGVGDVAVLQLVGERPHLLDDLAQVVVVLGLRERPIERPQAEIGADLGGELFRRDGERVERDQHLVAGLGVEREIAPLLDDGAGERLDERPLRQPELMGGAGAFVLGLVAGE